MREEKTRLQGSVGAIDPGPPQGPQVSPIREIWRAAQSSSRQVGPGLYSSTKQWSASIVCLCPQATKIPTMRGTFVGILTPAPSGLTIVVFGCSASLSSAPVERLSRTRINE